MNHDEVFEIYTRTVGKVRSGTKLTNADFGERTFEGLRLYEEEGKVAVTIAADDVIGEVATRTKSELLAEVTRRRS